MDTTYCVIHDKGFFIKEYDSCKIYEDDSVVHFIGTYKECLGFITRSNAAQELVDSANKEHEEETYTREEVYLVAERSVHIYLRQILKKMVSPTSEEYTVEQIINSEIDTVKLF